MRGVDVLLRKPVESGKDSLGNPVCTWSEPEVVSDVLVAVGATADSLESNRPDGVTVAYTLVWPKSHADSLRGCQVKVPGDPEWYSVAGDPKPQVDGQMLRPYNVRNRVVEAVRDDG